MFDEAETCSLDIYDSLSVWKFDGPIQHMSRSRLMTDFNPVYSRLV